MAKNEVYTKREFFDTAESDPAAFPNWARQNLSRARDYAQNLSDDGQETPDEYAEDQIQYIAEDSFRQSRQSLSLGAQREIRRTFQSKNMQNRSESSNFPENAEQTFRRSRAAIHADELYYRGVEFRQQGGSHTPFSRRAIPVQEAQRAVVQSVEVAKKTAQDTARATQQSKRASIAAERTAEAAGKAAKAAAKATARAVKAIVEELKLLIMEIAAGGSTAAIVVFGTIKLQHMAP